MIASTSSSRTSRSPAAISSLTIEAHNYINFSPYSAISDERHHGFTLTFGKMQADMRDAAIYFRKKTGIKILGS